MDPREPFEEPPPSRAATTALVVIGLAAILSTVLAIYGEKYTNLGMLKAIGPWYDRPTNVRPVGTSGELDSEPAAIPTALTMPAEPAAVVPPELVEKLNSDPNQIVGKQFTLQIPLRNHANDQAFWVGSGNERFMVVVSRDNRDGASRQRGLPSSKNVQIPMHEDLVTVVGTVQRVPYVEATASWGLTRDESEFLRAHPYYVRVDQIL